MDETMKQFQQSLIELETEAEHLRLARHQLVETDRMRNGNREALTASRKRARTTKTSVLSPFESIMREIGDSNSRPLVKEACATCGNHDSNESTWMMFPVSDVFARVPFHAAHTILEAGQLCEGGESRKGNFPVKITYVIMESTRESSYLSKLLYVHVLEIMKGSLIGHPVENICAFITDGASHAVDSSELAFKLAAIYAFRKCYEAARPVILEPLMLVELKVPIEFQGTVAGDIIKRKGVIVEMISASEQSVWILNGPSFNDTRERRIRDGVQRASASFSRCADATGKQLQGQ
ncbi:hypothetical protein FEM48_Zijuj08G0060000 [Ziziphus jujuba var. spinosa]|uniref:Translation elongation factor EFG/EF2 domain-containing protein n=1 Tax=Ziziphus jujuba var. spinosa TaxID=714518 RepID=A0A978UXD8_ZIZJJ|nr:hypothetical protein FEM48_Zijuj08G0060000 [Ziziphus jujuba var. spinosa]